MANRTETLRLTPEALSEALTRAGLSLKDFCHVFDVGYETGKRWALPDTHPRAIDSPYWIQPVLIQLAIDPQFASLCRELRKDSEADAHEPEACHAD